MKSKQFETILYSAVGVAAMFVLLMGFNIVSAALKKRVDLTKEKAYTLSAGTKAILKKIDTPVKIRFYCTQPENPTPETVFLRGYAQEVQDLLGELAALVARRRLDREGQALTPLGVDAVRALRPASAREQLIGLGQVLLVLRERLRVGVVLEDLLRCRRKCTRHPDNGRTRQSGNCCDDPSPTHLPLPSVYRSLASYNDSGVDLGTRSPPPTSPLFRQPQAAENLSLNPPVSFLDVG